MQPINTSFTPQIYFTDLEVSHVPVDRGEPQCFIKQICVCDPSRKEGERFFEAHVKLPKQLRHKEDEASFQPGQKEVKKRKWKKVWPRLKEFVNQGLDGNRFAVIVGHNIYKHDWPILANECARIKEAIPKYWKPFCTLYLAGALGIPKGQKSLAALCQKYKVKHLPQHDACNDVKMLIGVFNKMTEGADREKLADAMVLPPREHPVRAAAAIIKGSGEAELVFFDFEATGLFPTKRNPGPLPRAIELAAFIPSTGATFNTLIDPGLDDGIQIPEIVVRLTGITEQMIREAAKEFKQKTGGELNFKTVWTSFEKWMDHQIGSTVKKVAVLAGHNIWGYDLRLYKAECERFGMSPKWWTSVDTLAFSRHIYAGCKPQYKGFHKLQEIRGRMGIAEDHAHRALGDVRVNYEVWKRFVDGVDKKKLSKALLSGHPILSTGQLVRERGGTFKPENYMVVTKDDIPPLVPALEKEAAPSLPPAVIAGKKKAPAVQKPSQHNETILSYFSPTSNQSPKPAIAPPPISSKGKKRPRAIDLTKPDSTYPPLKVARHETPNGMELTFTFNIPRSLAARAASDTSGGENAKPSSDNLASLFSGSSSS